MPLGVMPERWQPATSVVRETAQTLVDAKRDSERRNHVWLAAAIALAAAVVMLSLLADAGTSWTPQSDFERSLQISSLAIDPAAPTTIYAGTGRNSFSSVGILKSVDSGNTWSTLGIQFGLDKRVTSVLVRPGHGAQLLAGLRYYGVFRSPDGGATWTRVLTTTKWAYVVSHQTADVIYAALGGPASSTETSGIYKSGDGGVNWTLLGGGLPAANGQVLVATAGSNVDTVYALFIDDSLERPQGLYKSADGGQSWSHQTLPNYCAPVCTFNNVLAVHPQQPDTVFVGGLGLWRSIDAGATWANISSNVSGPASYLHIDQHALAFAPDGSRLYSGGDGGIWASPLNPTDPAAYQWTSLNDTLSIAQFYSIATSSYAAGLSLGGTQDNNTQLYRGSKTWTAVRCGDGIGAAIAGTSPPALLTTCLRLGSVAGVQIDRSTDYGSTWASISVGGGERSSVAPPIGVDPWVPNRVYTGTTRLYRSEDSGASWAPISDDRTGGAGVISAIGAVRSEPESLYAGTSMGKVHVRSTTTWHERSAGLPAAPISVISVARQRPDTAFAAFRANVASNIAGAVWMTTDRGLTWTSLGAPPPPSSSELASIVGLAVFDSLSYSIGGRTLGVPGDLLIAATPYGVFQRQAAAAGTWQRLGNGLPLARVTGLAVHLKSATIRVSTYGRGVWEVSPRYADVSAFAQALPTTASLPNDRLVRLNLINRGTSSTANVQFHVVARPSPTSLNLQYSLEAAELNGATCRANAGAGGIAGFHCERAVMAPGTRTTVVFRIHYTPPASTASNTRAGEVRLEVTGAAAGDAFDPDSDNNTLHTSLVWN